MDKDAARRKEEDSPEKYKRFEGSAFPVDNPDKGAEERRAEAGKG